MPFSLIRMSSMVFRITQILDHWNDWNIYQKLFIRGCPLLFYHYCLDHCFHLL